MKNLLFISGSRADYNKISILIKFLAKSNHITVLLVDLHNDKQYGYTGDLVHDDLKNYVNIEVKDIGDNDTTKTISYFSWLLNKLDTFMKENHFHMTFVHGDRLSALAGAMVSNYNNTPVCQIEAGDVSGNIDESIRHAITKFSHRFLVTDKICKKRVLQLGEEEKSIYIIGQTSVFSKGVKFVNSDLKKELGKNYCIFIYHPLFSVTNDENLKNFKYILNILSLYEGKTLLIQCNNDPNGDLIINEYKNLNKYKKIIFRKNIPPEKFYSLLKNAKFIIGNSSCGICEAPYLGVPTIDVGDRQHGRNDGKNIKSIFHVDECSKDLGEIIKYVVSHNFDKGKTFTISEFKKNLKIIFDDKFFDVDLNKKFIMR